MNPFAATDLAIRAVELIAACGIAISSIEWLTNARHLRDDALLSWPIARLRTRALSNGAIPRTLDPLLGYPGVLWVIGIRSVAALVLISNMTDGPIRAGATAVVALAAIAISVRSPFGLDGSDQMATFLFSTLALTRLFPGPVTENIFLWVVCLQACLAYFTAGFAKLVSPVWRSTTVIPGVASTRMYGSPAAARLMAGRPWLSAGIAWTVIVPECLFPLVLVVPFPGVLALLGWGALFHILTGVMMGLNTFIWMFLATYPAVLWAHAQLHGG